MSMLEQVTKGRIIRPALFAIYGPGGIGKSTLATKSPAPIFLGSEAGTDHLDTVRFPQPKKYEDVLLCIRELLEVDHQYSTLAIDSVDWVEPLIHNYIARKHDKPTIELAAGGYGKGYIEAYEEWRALFKSLNRLRDERAMNIILIAHPVVVTTTNPQTQSTYNRYELKLHKHAKALLYEFVDALFFATFEVFAKKSGEDTINYKTNNRVLYGTHDFNDGFDAKNRYGLTRPIPMDSSWDDIIAMCKLVPVDKGALLAEIATLIDLLKDEEQKSKIRMKVMEANEDMLVKMLARLKELTGGL